MTTQEINTKKEMRTYKSSAYNLTIVKESNDAAFLKAKFTCSRDAAEYARKFYQDDLGIYESMFLILMNRSNNTIAWVKISQGGISGTVCDPAIIAKYAIEILASNVILVHNHPSGNVNASKSDIDLTHRIKTGLKLFDINLLDHIIITEESYTSLADEGTI